MADVTRDPSIPEPPHGDGPRHPTVRFEHTDVRVRPVIIVIAAFACLGVAILWGVWAWFGSNNRHESVIKESPFPLAEQPSMKLPAEPRLEQLDRMADKPADAFPRLEAKEEVLNGFGPTNESGFVHIPIKRAMALIVDKLPAEKGPPPGPSKSTGLLDDGEPNSGRVYRGERR
jgi:hypothetical protein